MGVDIPDIRYVIHLGLCASALDYIQQAGRAGRDGQVSACVQLITPGELEWHRRRLQAAQSREDARSLEQLLHIFLGGGCISQGFISLFNQKSKPCGTCSACLRRQKGESGALATVPELNRMKARDLRAWCLYLTRDHLARERGVRPERLLAGSIIEAAADTGQLDPEGLDHNACERLLAVMRP